MTTTLVMPWTIRQGADVPFGPITWSTGAPVLPVDLTGCTATCMLRQLPTDATPLLTVTTTPSAQGAIVLGGKLGTVLVLLTRAATLTLPAGALGGAAAVEGIWGQGNLDILFPPNANFAAGQLWPFWRGPIYVTASVDH